MNFLKFPVILIALFSVSLFAQDLVPQNENFSPTLVTSSVQSNEEGVAIDGFDTVAYFNQEKAVKGEPQFSCEYQNKTWYFSSAENRDTFLADPEGYTPEFGGYCAHSLSNNELVRGNPESFVVHDNKLYLYVNDTVANKDKKLFKEIEEKANIFANKEKVRKKNWFLFESRF